MNAAADQPKFIVELEQQVLGAILVGGDFRLVRSFLRTEHFILDVHQIIFKAISSAFEQYC